MVRALGLLALSVVGLGAMPMHAAEQTPAGVNCPTIAEQQQNANKRHTDGTEAKAAIPAERSGILPSAGNYPESAAPTVEQSGQEMPSPLDCPLMPGHPNSLKPGATNADMPDVSKRPATSTP
ncbi:MAG: hypothetical protein SH859_12905 [Hyphomicrobium aestuarii]|nr:hypothetical protein [Hyphomicrobium aestuarii]